MPGREFTGEMSAGFAAGHGVEMGLSLPFCILCILLVSPASPRSKAGRVCSLKALAGEITSFYGSWESQNHGIVWNHRIIWIGKDL